ncbi:hypothetical protein D3C72_1316430 [compost metagenome]
MHENRTYVFTLEDISKIVAEKIKASEGISYFTGLKVKHDEKGLIYFELRH